MRERAFGVGFHNSPAQPCANIFDVADRFRVAWHTTGLGRELLSEPSPHTRHRGRPPRHGGWRGRCCRHPRRYRPILLDGFPGRLPTVRSRYWPMECGRSIGANSGRPPTGLRTKTCPAAVAADSHGYISRQTWHSAVHSVRPRSTRYPCRLRHSGRESGRRTTV